MRTIVVIPAGGVGERFNNDNKKQDPKQFLRILGRSVIAYTLECFTKYAVQVQCIAFT